MSLRYSASMSEKILSPDGLSFWDGEDWVSMEQNDTPKSEKILSPDGLNYLYEGRWIPLSLDQNSKNNTNEHEIFTSNVNFSDIELMGVNYHRLHEKHSYNEAHIL